jgi:hypothetical protein
MYHPVIKTMDAKENLERFGLVPADEALPESVTPRRWPPRA